MSYEYGSADLGINNPFKIEGSIRAARGILLSIIGIYAIFTVKSLVEQDQKLVAWFAMGVGLLLMIHGLTVASFGIMQVMRFFVGRGVPTSLAKNRAKSESHTNEPNTVYSAQDLEQMLQGRKNLTISEPQGWFARAAHSLFPSLIFLPYAYRNIAQQLAQALAKSLFGALCFGLTWFSGASGLTAITETAVLEYMALGLGIYFLVVWARCGKPLSRNLQHEPDAIGLPVIAICLTISILLPIILMSINAYWTLPELKFDTSYYLMLVLVFAVFTSAMGYILIKQRANLVNPRTDVSEMRDNWQESIHPQEIFINFENIVMANRRYKEVPNRVYREYNAELKEEGSDDKGQFSGETIQETQPAYMALPLSKLFMHARYFTTVVGHFALFWAAVSVFLNYPTLIAFVQSSTLNEALQQSHHVVSTASFIAILWVFGGILTKIAHAFWSEMCFESLVVFFQCQGTYTESRLSTGTGIHDSLRSENVLVRSSMTPWLLVSRLVTSCFTASGEKNLEHPRHILEFHDADEELEKIVFEMRGFLDGRETIASIKNMKDLNSTANIQQVNSAARLTNVKQTAAEAYHEQLLDSDRAIEFTDSGSSDDRTAHD